MVGKIYLAKIYYTDAKNFKLRPILIILKNSFGDYIYIPFTTSSKNEYSMEFFDTFLENGFFNKKSYLILDKICTINKQFITKEIAKVKDDVFKDILKKYCDFLGVK